MRAPCLNFPKRRGASRIRLARRRDSCRSAGPARRDHRASRPQDGHQCAELRRECLHGGLRGLALPDLGQPHRRAMEPDAGGATLARVRDAGRQAVSLERKDRRADRAAARLAPPGEALVPGRRADRGCFRRFRALPASQRGRAAEPQHGSLFLPAEAGEPLRSEALGAGHRATPRIRSALRAAPSR